MQYSYKFCEFLQTYTYYFDGISGLDQFFLSLILIFHIYRIIFIEPFHPLGR